MSKPHNLDELLGRCEREPPNVLAVHDGECTQG